jgi:hypothetical protein
VQLSVLGRLYPDRFDEYYCQSRVTALRASYARSRQYLAMLKATVSAHYEMVRIYLCADRNICENAVSGRHAVE